MVEQGYYDLATEFVPGDIFLLTFQYFLGMPVDERPSVITISYATVESYIPLSQASTMCTAAQQLTAAGMTIVVRFSYDAAACPVAYLHQTCLISSGCIRRLGCGQSRRRDLSSIPSHLPMYVPISSTHITAQCFCDNGYF